MSQSKHVVAENNTALAVSQDGTSALSIYLSHSVDEQFDLKSITPESLRCTPGKAESRGV
jgi:hypothetical protein